MPESAPLEALEWASNGVFKQRGKREKKGISLIVAIISFIVILLSALSVYAKNVSGVTDDTVNAN